jgi:hypothetical protein
LPKVIRDSLEENKKLSRLPSVSLLTFISILLFLLLLP